MKYLSLCLLCVACNAPGSEITAYKGGCGALGDRSYNRLELSSTDDGGATAALCHGRNCEVTVTAGAYPTDQAEGAASAWCDATQTFFYLLPDAQFPTLSIWAGTGAPLAGDSFTCSTGFVPGVVLEDVTDDSDCTSQIGYSTD
ncbi:MAG TPA: hypothetical protein VGM88_07360 [Kofleriaceae bacterium]|jgi:hypothetical protein